jgi:hypothetical protein
MKKLLLTFSLFALFTNLKGQNFIDWGKASVISNLIDYGFDTTKTEVSIIDYNSFIQASVKKDNINLEYTYYLDTTRIWNSCDSVVLKFYGCKCFNTSLETVLLKERTKWKKVSDSVYVNIRRPGKTTYYDKSKRPEYLIDKLEIKENKQLNIKSIHIFHIKITEEEFLSFKQIKNYR